MGEMVEAGEQCLHVGQIIHQIGQQDIIELFAGRKLLGFGFLKLQFRMTPARELDHGGTEIDARAACRLYRGQQVTQAAAQLQDAHPRGHHKGAVVPQQFVVIPLALAGTESGAAVVKRAAVSHRPSCYPKIRPMARTIDENTKIQAPNTKEIPSCKSQFGP